MDLKLSCEYEYLIIEKSNMHIRFGERFFQRWNEKIHSKMKRSSGELLFILQNIKDWRCNIVILI